MKTNYLLLLSFLFFLPFNLQSQQFVKEGNQWTYVTVDFSSGDLQYVDYKMEGDTLIDNIEYKKIYSSSDASNNVYELENYFIRLDQEGKTFKIDANLNESLMIDKEQNMDDIFFVNTICEFTLNRKDSFQINNNQWTKRFMHSFKNFEPIGDNTISGSINGFQWIENVGNLRNPFLGLSDYCPISSNDFFQTTLACFVSDDNLIYGDQTHCSHFVTNTEELPNFIDITLYPNPFSEEFVIKFGENQDKIKRLLLTDIHGKVYHEINDINSQKIIIKDQNFPSGMYFVDIILSDNQRISKKVIKL